MNPPIGLTPREIAKLKASGAIVSIKPALSETQKRRAQALVNKGVITNRKPRTLCHKP